MKKKISISLKNIDKFLKIDKISVLYIKHLRTFPKGVSMRNFIKLAFALFAIAMIAEGAFAYDRVVLFECFTSTT
jgi:hypothetical protein